MQLEAKNDFVGSRNLLKIRFLDGNISYSEARALIPRIILPISATNEPSGSVEALASVASSQVPDTDIARSNINSCPKHLILWDTAENCANASAFSLRLLNLLKFDVKETQWAADASKAHEKSWSWHQ